ncbi:hypothetical protein FOL47_009425 [Perkinsus chesapeaki]|uniref:Uncharacterized protein n=1 Tax=Perkinsus chesapeaki TaxID=330153 RepID=A0A7J6L8E1_PERCH|nr:hypothetical protein FOL47_009425 [Perkinsus chesapeaki]
MEVRRGNRLMSRVVAEWFEISMDTTAQHERSVEVSRKARLGHILATWLRVAHRNRLDRRNEEICRRYCRQQNSANLRWMIQDKITNQIGEVLKRKKDTSRVALLQWKTWRQGRSIAAGRALMVDAILNRETYRLVNEVLYGWKCECLKSALLLRVAKELIHRREMVYLRKGFHGLKQEGTRLRFGCRRLCAAVSSALHRRGWWMLWELLLHSRDEAIQCYEVSRMKSLLRLSCRRTLRRYLIEWKNVVMKSHERLGRLKLILGEWTEDGIVRTCLKGWKNMLIYRRQELAKIELLSLMEKHVGMVERTKVIAWFKISISAQRLRYHVEYLVRSRHITFLSAWRNIALTGRRTRIAGTTAGALSLQALVHRRLRAGMYCLRDGYNRSSKRSLLMLSVLSTIRWALKITHSGDNDGKADSERRFILSSLMLKWRSLAHRRRFGFRLLTEALVRRQKKIISLAV